MDASDRKNLYVTGGLGPSAQNEGLTFDYDLPNETAYAETCAAVALVFWASRMLGPGPDRTYADVMERALYNGALVGLSLDGTRFFMTIPWRVAASTIAGPGIAALAAPKHCAAGGVCRHLPLWRSGR